MNKNLLGVLIPLAALLAGCATPAPECTETPGAAIGITFLHHVVPLFDASMDGVPVRMLLDTGAAISVVTPKTAEAAHLPVYARHIVTLSGTAGSLKVPMVTVRNFRIGNEAGGTFNFPVVDIFGKWHAAVLSVVSGTLGADILRNYNVDLDFPAKQVILVPIDHCRQTAPWPGAKPVRFTVLRGGQIVFPITVEGRAMSAILDTGSTFNDMPESLFEKSGLADMAPVLLRSTISHGIGAQTYKSELYGFQNATIGGVAVHHPVFGVGGQAPAGPYAVIGETFIQRHEIYISYATGTMYVRPGG